ncbi:MAG: acetylornithine deacetylase [Geminicoccaceae bacterium]|nr:acetylornithine deacetylase [Geminicoccaceae bacterium]
MTDIRRAIGLLRDLVAFPSLSRTTTLPIAGYVGACLDACGVPWCLDGDGGQANLFATIGPEVDGGVVLSGHFDVVPAGDEGWGGDPFVLREAEGRLIGRGAVDMKGFLACCLAMVPVWAKGRLRRPVHLAFTHDEEVGSFGAARLPGFLAGRPFRPGIAVVGEPTGMRPIVGHKAGFELITTVTGLAGHAATPSRGLNAVYYAGRLVAHIEATAARLAAAPRDGSPFDPPYSTLSVGRIEGGIARNVIPDTCRIVWEVRPLPEDDGGAIVAGIEGFARDTLLPEMQARHPEAGLAFVQEAHFPGLAARPRSKAADLVRRLWTDAPGEVVSFGTDGGHLQAAGLDTVVFGPGSIRQAHTPDEYVEVAALEDCLAFLDRLGRWLEEG